MASTRVSVWCGEHTVQEAMAHEEGTVVGVSTYMDHVLALLPDVFTGLAPDISCLASHKQTQKARELCCCSHAHRGEREWRVRGGCDVAGEQDASASSIVDTGNNSSRIVRGRVWGQAEVAVEAEVGAPGAESWDRERGRKCENPLGRGQEGSL
jgi:hypothetical protein